MPDGNGGRGFRPSGCELPAIDPEAQQTGRKKSKPRSGLIRLLLEIKNSFQRVNPQSSEHNSGHLGGKRADWESGLRPREGAALSPAHAFPGPLVTAHGHLPVAPSGRAWPWEGPCPRPRPVIGGRARPPTREKKARSSAAAGGRGAGSEPLPSTRSGQGPGPGSHLAAHRTSGEL